MKKFLFYYIGSIVLLGIGIATAWGPSGIFGERASDRTIAMSWGDGKYGKNFYGARVYLVPDGSEYSVQARVLIGPGNGMSHDCGEIGRVRSAQEGIDRFGTIAWEEKGLTIGDPAKDGFQLERKRIESHR